MKAHKSSAILPTLMKILLRSNFSAGAGSSSEWNCKSRTNAVAYIRRSTVFALYRSGTTAH